MSAGVLTLPAALLWFAASQTTHSRPAPTETPTAVTCPGVVHADSDWVGASIKTKEIITADAAACCAACVNHTGCRFWTRSTDSLQPPLGRCYLKSSASSAKRSLGFEAGSIDGAEPSGPPAPPSPQVPPTFAGVGVVPLSCAPDRAMQAWELDGGRIRSAANRSLCLTAGLDSGPARGGVLYTEPCAEPGLAASQNFSLQSSPWPGLPGTLITSGDGQCVTMRGCCDGGPFQLGNCNKCNPDIPVSPPADCLMEYNVTARTFTTVVSGLCLDTGMDLPQRACSTPSTAAMPFCNSTLPPAMRAADLVGRLTLHEKTAGVLSNIMSDQSKSNGTAIDHNLRQTAGIMRLGVPPLLYNEAMHGICALCLSNGSCPTVFPNQITQTAAWNRSMWRAVASALGYEGRALANAGLDANNYWAPDVNPYRDPRYGRGQETGGEDAWLNEQVATEYVLGLQDGPATGDTMLLATAACKHILIYDSQQPGTRDVNASLHDLHDYYLRPWRACATVAHSASMMCSYGSFNGLPDCLHKDYITETIRDKWNWTGFVVSDCDAIDNHHAYSPNLTAAAAAGLLAGVDIDCGPYYQAHLPAAVEEGLVSEADIDAAALRILTHQFKLGVFDPFASSTNPYDAIGLNEIGSETHVALARESAIQSMTLLKNEGGLLPVSKSAKLAFVGPHANSTIDLLGNDYPPGNRAVFAESPLAAALRLSLAVQYAPGCADLTCANADGFSAAVAAAKSADVVVVFLGISSGFENEGHDRKGEHALDLPGHQLALAQACVAANPKTVVVLAHGGMVHIDELVTPTSPTAGPGVPSILTMFYPGQEAGDALMSVLLGERSPAGRLPYLPHSILVKTPRDEYQQIVDEIRQVFTPMLNGEVARSRYTWYSRGFVQERGLIWDNDLRSGSGITYRYWTGKPPLFAFGAGLSYTKFSYSWAEKPAQSVSTAFLVASGGKLGLSIHVTNAGTVDADAVVLAFVRVNLTETETADDELSASAAAALAAQHQLGCPLKTLAGFSRVHVHAGARVTTTFNISPREIACVGEDGSIVLRSGTVTLEVGDVVAPAIALTTVTGAAIVLPE